MIKLIIYHDCENLKLTILGFDWGKIRWLDKSDGFYFGIAIFNYWIGLSIRN
jgi:hypothetical protein